MIVDQSQKSGTRRENRIRNAADSPDSSPFIPDLRGISTISIFHLVGKSWDGRETTKSQTVWDFLDIWTRFREIFSFVLLFVSYVAIATYARCLATYRWFPASVSSLDNTFSSDWLIRGVNYLDIFPLTISPRRNVAEKGWSFFSLNFFPFQNNASKTLLAIMESRHDTENAERILYNMTPQQLVRLGQGYYPYRARSQSSRFFMRTRIRSKHSTARDPLQWFS